MITLIIVDTQVDFISGTMAVENAKQVVENIKSFITRNQKNIDKVIFTLDWHPYYHCSFKRNGGQWPTHCVQHTPGACIEPKLLKLVQSQGISYEVSLKGMIKDLEEYGAFSEIEFVQDALGSRYYFDSIAVADADTEFIVCGIAGDYCVKSTIENMIKGDITPKIFLDGVASIDDGSIIKEFIDNNKLEVV